MNTTPPESTRSVSRSERLGAALISAIIGVGIGWGVAVATARLAPAVVAGLAGASALYLWLTRHIRRAARARARPIPEEWWDFLEARFPPFLDWDEPRRREFLAQMQVFLADQRIIGVGCEPSEQDRVMIAGCAVLMALGFAGARYPNTRDILVYPTAFSLEYEHDEEGEHLGEVLSAGPIILSRDEIDRAFDGEDWVNVCIHELAHVVDEVAASPEGDTFRSDFDDTIHRFMSDPQLLSAIRRGESPIDDYALENPQEFWAVISEVFFEDPEILWDLHPHIYDWVARAYRQDPVRNAGFGPYRGDAEMG